MVVTCFPIVMLVFGCRSTPLGGIVCFFLILNLMMKDFRLLSIRDVIVVISNIISPEPHALVSGPKMTF